jgi:FkbM family methyltransferase
MNLNAIINEISNREEIKQQPPVLVDVGASYGINYLWKKIAGFSICIAFDADDRQFEYLEEEKSEFKKLIKVNKIVVHKSENETMDFYLTKSPYCSSLLEPDSSSLSNFHYSDMFEVVDRKRMGVVELPTVLKKMDINYIDWFKIDTQGTDLRLFKSINESIRNKTILLETEPGFIDSYKHEDKIADLLHFMESNKDFFLIDFKVKGALRIPKKLYDNIYKKSNAGNIPKLTMKIAPGWAEVTYMNSFDNSEVNPREFMLAWLFSTFKGHHEIAYVYAHNAIERFGNDSLWNEFVNYSEKQLKWNVLSKEGIVKLLRVVHNKYINKHL